MVTGQKLAKENRDKYAAVRKSILEYLINDHYKAETEAIILYSFTISTYSLRMNDYLAFLINIAYRNITETKQKVNLSDTFLWLAIMVGSVAAHSSLYPRL